MKIATINNATHNPGAPSNWTPAHGTCGTLPIVYDPAAFRGIGNCRSAWKPSADDIAVLLRGGYILLDQVGWQVPVMLSVGDNTVARDDK